MEKTNSMTVEEGNRIIAEFMGEKNIRITEGEVWIDENPVRHTPPYGVHCEYHTSWDWLMPVVEKIESLFEESISVNITAGGCTIEISTQYAMATDVHLPNEFYNNEELKINNVWTSVCSFIQWYNKQQPLS